MASAASPEEIRSLERDLRDTMQRQDFVAALDICEEIESKIDLKAAHLTAKGQCLLKLRRKQDAKKILLEAFDLDPGFDPAIKLLDESFPGWEKLIKPLSNPPPPPQQQRPVQRSTPPQRPSQTQYAEPSDYYEAPPQRQQAQQWQTPTAAAQQDPGEITTSESLINWRYVMDDLKEARKELGSGAAKPEIENVSLP